jgi:hypothetical protein
MVPEDNAHHHLPEQHHPVLGWFLMFLYTSTMGCIWVMGFLTGISNMHMAKSIRRIKASVYLISPFLIVDSVIPKIGFMAKAAGKPKPCIWR